MKVTNLMRILKDFDLIEQLNRLSRADNNQPLQSDDDWMFERWIQVGNNSDHFRLIRKSLINSGQCLPYQAHQKAKEAVVTRLKTDWWTH